MIRQATIEDRDDILAMAYNFRETFALKDMVDNTRMYEILTQHIEDEDKIVLVDTGKGFLLGMKAYFYFGRDTIATETAWWVEPKYRETKIGRDLLGAFEEWAKEHNCLLINLSCYDQAVGDYYTRKGYTLHECSYVKVL